MGVSSVPQKTSAPGPWHGRRVCSRAEPGRTQTHQSSRPDSKPIAGRRGLLKASPGCTRLPCSLSVPPVTPVSWNPEPPARSVPPMSWNPHRVRPWRQNPSSGYPDIGSSIPPLITLHPDVSWARPDWPVLHNDWRRSYSYVDLSKSCAGAQQGAGGCGE